MNEKKKKEIQGREVRRSHTALFKVAVIVELQPGVTQDQVANKYCINQPLISKWYKEKIALLLLLLISIKNCLQNRKNQQSI